MTARANAMVFALACAAAGCAPDALPPEGQLRLFVDTDAVLPAGPGETIKRTPLFDRLRIEVFAPGAAEPCAGCTRDFGIDHATVYAGRASIGVVAPPGRTGYRARVRLYRSNGSDTVEPRPTSTLESVVALPAVESDAIVDVHVVLRTEDLGTRQGTLEAPVAAERGPAEGKLAGTWAASYDRGCEGAPVPGEVCVPGGAYWMGDVSIGTSYGNVSSERLVVVSPFYLDATEVTVAQLRASGVVKIGSVLSHAANAECTYTKDPGEFDDHPVVCVTYHAAVDYCAAKGARLASEAEWELAASARRSAHAVWGDDPPHCGDAIYARADVPGAGASSRECLALGSGTAPAGSGALDRLELDGGTIVDLAGNASEWVADAWAEQGDPCWSGAVLYDPLCTSDGPPAAYTVRGASWHHPASSLRAALRADVDASGDPISSVIGFRCARPAGGP